MDLIISSLYHAISLSTMLISQQCLFLALTVLDRAYFRDMLIFETMLIFARVRTVVMLEIESFGLKTLIQKQKIFSRTGESIEI